MRLWGIPSNYAPFKTDKATTNRGLHLPDGHCESRKILRPAASGEVPPQPELSLEQAKYLIISALS